MPTRISEILYEEYRLMQYFENKTIAARPPPAKGFSLANAEGLPPSRHTSLYGAPCHIFSAWPMISQWPISYAYAARRRVFTPWFLRQRPLDAFVRLPFASSICAGHNAFPSFLFLGGGRRVIIYFVNVTMTIPLQACLRPVMRLSLRQVPYTRATTNIEYGFRFLSFLLSCHHSSFIYICTRHNAKAITSCPMPTILPASNCFISYHYRHRPASILTTV